MVQPSTGRFGLHEPLKYGGSTIGAATAGIEVGRERGRKAAREERAVAGEERAVAGEERAVAGEARKEEEHAFGMKTKKWEQGRAEKVAGQDDAANEIQYSLAQAAHERYKLTEVPKMFKDALEIGENGGWPLAAPIIMAGLLKGNKTPSSIVANAEPGTSDGKTGYFMTNMDGQRVQVDGEDLFLPRSLPDVKGKYVITADGVQTYDDKIGRWVTMGKGSGAGAGVGTGARSAIEIARDQTPLEKKLDERIASESAEWMNNKPNAIKKLQSIRGLITKMTGKEYNRELKQWVDDPENPGMERGWKDWAPWRLGRSVLPDVGKRAFDEEMFNIMQEAHLAVQATLKATLGGQFAMREADMLFARTFDIAATPQENARRLVQLAEQMELRMHTKDGIIKYFNKERTMIGYLGPMDPETEEDFYLDKTIPMTIAPPAAPEGERKVVSQGGHLYDAVTKEYIGPAQ